MFEENISCKNSRKDMLLNYCFSEGLDLLKLAIMEKAIKK